jgi:RNA polymerase sigma factor (sigma-70 family)
MNCDRSGAVLRQVHLLFRSGTVAGMTDGQLLERFAKRRGPESEAAFAALVARHGSMVLGVCKQLLGDTHDADDAFQAAFLTLADKAGALRQPDRVGPWLYGVAVRKSRKLKQQRERRRRHERRREATNGEKAPEELNAGHGESMAALHEEIARLPEKYRAPIVLCYLQGHTHETAAAALGWPLGTVRGRLARARDQLRARMTARGAAPAGLVPASGSVPTTLADAVVSAAVRKLGKWCTLLAHPAVLKVAWPRIFGARALRIATLLVLAGGVAGGGFAAWRRAPVAEARTDTLAKSPEATVGRPKAPIGETVTDLPPDQLPRWVTDAVRSLQPQATIARAIRESDTSYLVEIRRPVEQPPITARVTGRFARGRKLTLVRRVREGSLAGRGV